MTLQNPKQQKGVSIPDTDGSIFRAINTLAYVQLMSKPSYSPADDALGIHPEVQNTAGMSLEHSGQLACNLLVMAFTAHVPDANCAVTATTDKLTWLSEGTLVMILLRVFVELQTKNAAGVPSHSPKQCSGSQAPDLDSSVARAGDNSGGVELKTINTSRELNEAT